MTKLIFIFITTFTTICYSQKKIVVCDNITKEPLGYSVVYQNDNGFYTDLNGVFNTTKVNIKDSIIISSFGYHPLKTILNKKIDTLFLSPKTQVLEEVVLKLKKQTIINPLKSAKSFGSMLVYDHNEIIAIITPRKKKKSIISQVIFKLKKYLKTEKVYKHKKEELFVHLRLNVYKIKNGEITNKIYSSSITTINAQKNTKLSFDISKKIELSHEGLAFGVEFLGFQNKSQINYIRFELTKEKFNEFNVRTFISYPLDKTKQVISLDSIINNNPSKKSFKRNIVVGFVLQ